jgi:hypothetical protein
MLTPLVSEAEQKPACVAHVTRPLHPAEQHARSRRPPLIEYCAPGSYVIISSQQGEVHLEPDSRAWFDWLATLSSFRFIGRGTGALPRIEDTNRASRRADCRLLGFCPPSDLQALPWRDGELNAYQPGAHRCQTPI